MSTRRYETTSCTQDVEECTTRSVLSGETRIGNIRTKKCVFLISIAKQKIGYRLLAESVLVWNAPS
jgi:hypothetical protein